MKLSESQFLTLISQAFQQLPTEIKSLKDISDALKAKGASDFSYYREDDNSSQYSYALSCMLNGHKYGVYLERRATSGTPYLVRAFHTNTRESLGTPERVVRWITEKAGIKSSRRRIMNADEQLVDYLRTHGESQDQDNSEFCPLQLAIGALVEAEHTDDFDAAVEIAKDHLAEDDCYYGTPEFTDEAIGRIEDLDSFEPSEELEAVDSWKERLLSSCKKYLASSGKTYMKLGPLCLCSDKESLQTGDDLVTEAAAVPFNVSGKKVWVSGESGDLEILTPDERIYVEPEDRSLPVEYILEQYLGLESGEAVKVLTNSFAALSEPVSHDQTFVVPVRVSRPITSMSIKTAESYFKTGIMTRKEVVAYLTHEEGWSNEEANQIADYWERCFSSMALVKVHYSDVDGFTPEANICSAAVADILSGIESNNPKQTLLSYAASAPEMEPVKSDKTSNRGLMFTARDYYKKAEIVPTYKDFVGYLRYTGEFEDYKQAYTDWKALCKSLDPIDGDD